MNIACVEIGNGDDINSPFEEKKKVVKYNIVRFGCLILQFFVCGLRVVQADREINTNQLSCVAGA